MVQLSRFQRRHTWSLVGAALVFAAFAVITAAGFHIDGLPSRPFACDEFECGDSIYDLRRPYTAVTAGAVLAGTIGMLLLMFGRPVHSTRFTQRPRGWSRVGANSLLSIGVIAGVLLPWWTFMNALWNGPRLTLVIILGITLVHVTLWWWLRRQHGRDSNAWATALIIQAAASHLTIAASLPLLSVIPWLAMATQPVFLLIGARLGSRPPAEDTESHSVAIDAVAPTSYVVYTAAGLLVIIIATAWAALPRPIPEGLQPRIEADDWPKRQHPDPPPLPVEAPNTAVPTKTPASEPTRQAPACTAAELDVTIDGWDAATGARAAALVVTNQHESQTCQMQGLPELRILQAGTDMQVKITEYGLSSGSQEVYEDITIGPDESAEAILHWRGERSAGHDDSAQQAQIKIGDTWAEATFEFQQDTPPQSSPFDLVDHSELEISKWAPSD